MLEILTQEMEPVITDLFRKILGRDASKQEFEYWINRFRVAERIDVLVLAGELQNSSERSARESQKTAIIQSVENFLRTYLANTPEATADLFNRVVYYETFDNKDGSKSSRMRVTKYGYLTELEDIDYKNVFAVIGKKGD